MVAAELEETAGCDLVVVEVLPVFKYLGLQEPVLLSLDPGMLAV